MTKGNRVSLSNPSFACNTALTSGELPGLIQLPQRDRPAYSPLPTAVQSSCSGHMHSE